MGDPNGPPLRRVEILAALNRHDVDFILVGGVAAQAQGATKPTNDLDLCVRWTTDNLDRVGAALTELDAGLRVARAASPSARIWRSRPTRGLTFDPRFSPRDVYRRLLSSAGASTVR